jgi:hypothetical protein
MIKFFITYIREIASFMAIVGTIGALVLWSHKSLHADILEIKKEIRDAHFRIDATNVRIDQTNSRIDKSYELILENQKEFNQKFYELLKEKRESDGK